MAGIILGIQPLPVQATEAGAPVFISSEIAYGDEIYNRINGRSYQENENISLEDLRYLQISHYDFDHEIQIGELIVNVRIFLCVS